MYLQIKKDLYLVAQEVELTKEEQAKPLHVITIIDRSGSMHGVIHSVVEDIKRFSLDLRDGEKNSIAWFSGEGYSDFALKSFEVNPTNKQVLTSVLDQHKSTLNTTCFSEILEKTAKFMDEAAYKNDNFALFFFTDGYPVVSNYSAEIHKIKSVLGRLRQRLAYSAFVGAGNYYNRELMTEMAATSGGSFIHLNKVGDSYQSLVNFAETSRDSQGQIEVDAKGALYPFSISGKSILTYDSGDKVAYTPSRSNKNVLFYLTEKAPKGFKEVTDLGSFDAGSKNNRKEFLIKGMYAAAQILSTNTKADLAIDVLGKLGDVRFIDTLVSARTNDEYGLVENELREAVFDFDMRLVAGQDFNHVPKEDVFCLMDLLEILQQDEQAGFFPRHEGWSYNKITQATKQDSKYPKFQENKNQKCYFNALKWNSEKLNLSLLAEIQGKIPLKEGAAQYGFAQEYPSKIYRNYSIVKDGYPNFDTLYVDLSAETMAKLKALAPKTLLMDFHSDQLGRDIYILNLKAIPVSNRAMAKVTSAKPLAEQTLKETILSHKQTVFNYLVKLYKKDEKDTALSAEQVAFLEDHGIKNGIFSPETSKVDPTDFYFATEFDLAVKGYATSPKAKEVAAKIDEAGDKAKLKDSEMFAAEAYREFKKLSKPDMQLATAESLLSQVKKELFAVRSQIQRTKMAVILSKKWFDEFPSREDCVLAVKHAGKEFFVNFKIRNVKVSI